MLSLEIRLKCLPICLTFLYVSITFAAVAPNGVVEQRVATAREEIAKDKNSPGGYNDLALALVRMARQSADPKYCGEADTAVTESLKLDPNGFDGQKTHAVVWLCEQRWDEARAEFTVLNKRTPDDVMIWGYLADADMALGDYDKAEKSVQTMLNLRQVNPQGLQRGAELRVLFGFNDPALEWWNSAMRLTSSNDLEERAWIETHIAQIDRMTGHHDLAEAACKQALDLMPSYPWALEERGQNELAQRKNADAADTFAALVKAAPAYTSAIFELGLAQQAAGTAANAQQTFADFEKRATAQVNDSTNANLALIRYYAGPGKQPAQAVRIAKVTLQHRNDIQALEVYAEALAAAGDYKDASDQMAAALKPGVNDPAWLLEAGRFAAKAGNPDTAHKYFQRGLEAAPGSPLATEIIQALAGTTKSGS